VLVCNAALNPYYGPQMGIPDEAFDKIMARTSAPTTGSPSSSAGDGGAQGRLDHHRVVDGGLRGSVRARRLLHLQGATCSFARNIAVEYGPQQHPRQLHRARTHQDRFRARTVENPETLKRRPPAHPCAASGEPDEIAGAAVFLASRAGSFTTGQTIVCDGGVTI